MKKVKEYIPIALLVTSLGLGFNLGCSQKQEAQQEVPKEEPKIEQTVKKEYIEKHVIGNKEYHLGEKFYTEHDNKNFNVASKVKTVNTDTEKVKTFYVGYQCDTDIEGKFHRDSLSITEKSKNQNYDRIIIQADRTPLGELNLNMVSIFHSGNLHAYFKKGHPEKEKYFKFGKEKLQLYGKLFDIEEKRKQAKGNNLYPTLKELDLSKLTVDDFKYDAVKGGLKAMKDGIEVHARTNEYFTLVNIYADQAKEACRMSITTFNPKKVGKEQIRVSLGDTKFELEDGKLRYIKDLYTEEQTQEIIKAANEKMEFIKTIIEQIVPKGKQKFDKRLLEKFE